MRTGHVVPTQTVMEKCERKEQFSGDVAKALWRYLRHDWGDVAEAERAANERALNHQARLAARYKTCGETILIFTDETRRITTIMLESEK